jgi:hypothetical protein
MGEARGNVKQVDYRTNVIKLQDNLRKAAPGQREKSFLSLYRFLRKRHLPTNL